MQTHIQSYTYICACNTVHTYTCACSTSYSVRLQEHICNEDWIIAEGCKGPGGERDVGLSFPSVECPWVRAKQLHIIRSKIERARLQNLKWNPTQEESHEFLIAFCLCSTAAGQKQPPPRLAQPVQRFLPRISEGRCSCTMSTSNVCQLQACLFKRRYFDHLLSFIRSFIVHCLFCHGVGKSKS